MRIGITITKSTEFRNKEQEFHNTYYYNLATAVTAPSESLVDEIVATEKNLHAADVTFKRAQVWSAGGNAAENQMLFQKELAGTGAGANNTSMDRERALLIQWKAGFDVRGKQVYLRKWFHSCGSPVGTTLSSSAILANTAEIPQSTRDVINAEAESLREVGSTESWELCAKSGRTSTDTAKCHAWLEHHQLGEMWR